MSVITRDTRQNILAAGHRTIALNGFSAVGLTEVLSEAGVPKGSFYHYFSSKDAFGVAMLEAYFDEYLAKMDRIFAQPNKTSAERLMDYWRHFHDIQSCDDYQGRCLVVKLGAEVSDLSESMRMTIKEGVDGIVDRVERIIRAGLDDGSLTIESTPRATAETLYDAWLGASVMAKIQRSPDPLDRALAATRQVLHS